MRTKAVARCKDGAIIGYHVWCQACKCAHSFPTSEKWYEGSSLYEGKRKPVWMFSGSLEKPSFQPSLRLYWTNPKTKVEKTICHCVVTSGMIQFCDDCDHKLKGQTLDLEEIPDSYSLG